MEQDVEISVMNDFFTKELYMRFKRSKNTMRDENGNVVYIKDVRQKTTCPLIESNSIRNFLLIGIDSRTRDYAPDGLGDRSDIIMIMSVNPTTGAVRLVSVARDCYTYIPGRSLPKKINAAMSLCGPDVLCVTVEDTLRIKIDGWAYVNFFYMADIIDAVGGIYCDVSSREIDGDFALNGLLADLNVLMGLEESQDMVTGEGRIKLNGRQAVCYARIRKIDDDYVRSARQVKVLRALADRFMKLPLTRKVSAIRVVLRAVVTNVPLYKMIGYAMRIMPHLRNISIEYMRLPTKGCFNSGIYGKEWSIRPNWNAMIPYVQKFFYGKTTQFDPVRDISQAPSLDSCATDLRLEDLLG